MSKEISAIVCALREQDWTLILSSDASRWKAQPPDKSKRIVTFSATQSETLPIIRDLRHQGFVWPPLDAKRREAADPRGLSIVKSTPFPPKPHPSVSTSPSQPHGAPDHSDANMAFIDLKEAKEYERLAASELTAARRKVDEAQETMERASAAYDGALSDLKQKKAAFDASFAAEVDGTGTAGLH